jgi:peptide/nickel transport system substrate-binding protein
VGTSAVVGALLALAPAAMAAGALRVDLSGPLPVVDPQMDYTSIGWQLEYATCRNLVSYPDAAGTAGEELVPDAATSLPTISADGLTYSFLLRPGLRFSDGEPLTAESYARALVRSLWPGLGPTSYFANIVGASAVHAGRATELFGVVVPDSRHLRIRLRQADPTLLDKLATPFACPVPAQTPLAPSFSPLPASGPYAVTTLTGTTLAATRNPYYTGHRPAGPDEIDYQAGVDGETAVQDVESGAADYLADGIPADQSPRLYDSYGPGSQHQQLFVDGTLGVRYLGLNTSRPLFADPTVRQAVNFALDRPAIIAALGPHSGEPTDQVLAPGMPGYRPISRYPLDGPDLPAALALMNGRTADAVLYTSFAAMPAAELIKAELAPIGIDVTIDAFSRGEQIQRDGMRNEPFDMTIEGWLPDFADGSADAQLFDGTTITDSNNIDISYFDDPTVNHLIHHAARLAGTRRDDAYASLDALLTADAPWAPIAVMNQLDFVSARVGGVIYQPERGLDLGAVQLAG